MQMLRKAPLRRLQLQMHQLQLEPLLQRLHQNPVVRPNRLLLRQAQTQRRVLLNHRVHQRLLMQAYQTKQYLKAQQTQQHLRRHPETHHEVVLVVIAAVGEALVAQEEGMHVVVVKAEDRAIRLDVVGREEMVLLPMPLLPLAKLVRLRRRRLHLLRPLRSQRTRQGSETRNTQKGST